MCVCACVCLAGGSVSGIDLIILAVSNANVIISMVSKDWFQCPKKCPACVPLLLFSDLELIDQSVIKLYN